MSLSTLLQSVAGNTPGPLSKSVAHFARLSGRDLLARTETFLRWQDGRRNAEVWPYSRALMDAPHPRTRLRDELGRESEGINFASHDYLSLSTHPAIRDAGVRALYDFGPHSACSPMLQGNTALSLQLEQAVAEMVQMEHIALFPTGWAACYGTITALIRPDDHVILDNLAHASLQQGAQAATRNVRRHEHLSLEAVRQHLQEIRAADTRNGILVVNEGLFSMDSDITDLQALQELCHEYDATLLIDVAHDLGALGPNGTGQIGIQNMLGKIDLIVGSFSKTMATNGGFLATHSRAVKHYVKTFGGPHIFSSGLSPVQAAIALEAIRIIRAPEGERLRTRLMSVVHHLRSELAAAGLHCMGIPSGIVPVHIGSEKVARLVSALLFRRGVFANLVEFPAVAVGASRFRMLAMAAHTGDDVRTAVREFAQAVSEVRTALEQADTTHAVVADRLSTAA
ncbi:MAG: aminotransferase class I/II-fold pyridoxal phosphate-dependent enzyme [Chloroherpetonaceae bacterium]|nr:aminotransferase class I/II-fold pyridoxal phosphate-dependent enzyme [Chthonomonadaceae bacterium]MDW8206430.1 aminotransferase class I/II-fold pyridoxal phosphate-dependent enzyme [Chloroherpetonaceae bacterium]